MGLVGYNKQERPLREAIEDISWGDLPQWGYTLKGKINLRPTIERSRETFLKAVKVGNSKK